MKKIILSAALVLALASCSAPATEEVVETVDTTAVAPVDTTCAVKCDTLAVDTCKK